MKKWSYKTAWSYIDQTVDPEYFVHFMDTAWPEKPEGKELYRITFDLLEIHEGDHILDVGCGTGGAVRALAKLVGREGRVLGVDNSQTMITEARKRTEGLNLPVEFHVSDVHNLSFADNTFDGCYSIGVFEIVDNPRQALAEMIRVARSGVRIVIPAPDLGIWAIDSPNRAVTRKILDFVCDNETNGWIGRQLLGLFKELGLTEIIAVPVTDVLTDYALAYQRWLCLFVENAQEAGVVSAAEAILWLDDLKQRAQTEQFFVASTRFYVAGRKP